MNESDKNTGEHMTRIREFAPHLGWILLTAGPLIFGLYLANLRGDFYDMLLTGFTGCLVGIIAPIVAIWHFWSEKVLVNESRSQISRIAISWGLPIVVATGGMVTIIFLRSSQECTDIITQIAIPIILMLLMVQGAFTVKLLSNEIISKASRIAIRQRYLFVGLALSLGLFLVLEFKGDKAIAFVSFTMIFILLAAQARWTSKLLETGEDVI